MCLDELQIIKLLAGELPDAQRDLALAHLAQCEACRQLHQSLQATWDQLGQWEPSVPTDDLTGAILAAAVTEPVRSHWYARNGIAAAVLMAMGLGWTIGRLPSSSPPSPHTSSPVTTEEMAQKIGLDVLGGDVGAFGTLFTADATLDNPVQGGQL